LLSLFGSASAATIAAEPRQAVALWLSQQLHRPVDASQILASPAVATLEGCTITRTRPATTGATSLSLRCPAPVLPQLVLLNFSLNAEAHPTLVPSGSDFALPKTPPLVRAGTALQADWRTADLHARLPVIAINSGAAGAQIRVRIANTNRILRARILSAHTVAILSAGA
jgi:hypothetical protein